MSVPFSERWLRGSVADLVISISCNAQSSHHYIAIFFLMLPFANTPAGCTIPVKFHAMSQHLEAGFQPSGHGDSVQCLVHHVEYMPRIRDTRDDDAATRSHQTARCRVQHSPHAPARPSEGRRACNTPCSGKSSGTSCGLPEIERRRSDDSSCRRARHRWPHAAASAGRRRPETWCGWHQ